MFKHIFVPYDGSNHSKHAFHVALEIATKFGSRITLVTCLFRPPEDESFYILEHVKNVDSLRNNAIIDLGRLQEIAKINKISAEVHVMSCNSAVETLTTFANSNKVDLIVMGTRGNTGFKPLLLGSVSIGVSQHATCPILLVK
ncbi:MAG: universal stress protein [Thaumarchaeota archaeon]|nr:universal stress protein [Nitrososphaerota archaeon]MDE1838528.1 universal stress protein [Nitrososphaerota archaeon]